jgi:hypothetical protein
MKKIAWILLWLPALAFGQASTGGNAYVAGVPSSNGYGSAGQVLTSNGAFPLLPSFQAAGAGSATLASTQVGFGSGSNLLTGIAGFTYNTTTGVLTMSNGSAPSIVVNGNTVPTISGTPTAGQIATFSSGSVVVGAAVGTGLTYTAGSPGNIALSPIATGSALGRCGNVSGTGVPTACSQPVLYALDWGATGNGTTNDTPAIQAAINYIEGNGGGTVTLPPLETGNAKYNVSSATANGNALVISTDNTNLRCLGSASGQVVEIYNSSTNGANAIHLGDPTETSGLGSHLLNLGIEGCDVEGVTGGGAAVRAYNASLRFINDSFQNAGSYGTYCVYACYSSYFEQDTWQHNGNDNFHSVTGLNQTTFNAVHFLSNAASYGAYIGGGSLADNSITFINPDVEGNLVGIYLDTSTGGIADVDGIGGDFESNTTDAIEQASTGNLTGIHWIGGKFIDSGEGIALGTVFGSVFMGPNINQAALTISNDNGTLVDNPILTNGATSQGSVRYGQVVGTPTEKDGAIWQASGNGRYPFQVGLNGAWQPVDVLSFANTNETGTGALTGTWDLSKITSQSFTFFTGVVTSFALTVSNPSAVVAGDRIRLALQNGGSGCVSGCTVTFSGATFLHAGTIQIPSTNLQTIVDFQADANGQFWAVGTAQ